MHICPALPQDAPAISALILSVAHFFTLDPQGRGAEDFLQSLQPGAVAARLAAPLFKTWCGWLSPTGALAGVIVVRDGTHLFHLFVAEPFQGQGHARQLWLHVLQHHGAAVGSSGGAGGMTVHSSPFAQGFYERMGFGATGPVVSTRGIAFVPMRRPATTQGNLVTESGR